jgi:hypothetical protein
MRGGVGILNVGAGDTKLVFDPNNPQDSIRAARIVRDMLRRGYALLVDSGDVGPDGKPIYTRAKAFDEAKCEYIIADYDPESAEEEPNEPSTAESVGAPREEKPRRGGRTKRVSAASVSAIAVPRSAGG